MVEHCRTEHGIHMLLVVACLQSFSLSSIPVSLQLYFISFRHAIFLKHTGSRTVPNCILQEKDAAMEATTTAAMTAALKVNKRRRKKNGENR